jgi:hypothetical protein
MLVGILDRLFTDEMLIVIVNYVLKGGELFNMVLLVPDDMPADASTLEGNVEEMRALFKDWDPRFASFHPRPLT